MSGNIPVFRANDIQAYTPPASTQKATEEAPATTSTQVSTSGEGFAGLGDLKQYDTDGNGKITKDEFNATRGGELLRAKAEKDQELFKQLDANGDGKLSNDEFLKALSNLGSNGTVAKVKGHIDKEFDQRKASDGTIHVDPKVQAGGGDTKTEKPKESQAAAKETKDYTVKGGDTLNKIARAHGVTLAELKEANPELFKAGKDAHGKTRTAGGDLIYPGDQLKIPTKAEKLAGGGGVGVDKQQVLDTVDRRVAQLQDEKVRLTKDLENPARTDEARARLQLLEMQMATLTSIKQNVGAYQPDPKLGAADASKVAAILGRIDQIAQNLGNPQQLQTAKSQLTAAYNLLQNPELYDPATPAGTMDAVINKQAGAVQHGTELVTQIVAEMDQTVQDLANPARQQEAQARLEQMRANIELISKFSGQVSDFRRSANLTPEQATKAADLLSQIDARLGNLTDPTKTAKAQTDLQALIDQLKAIK